MAKPNQVPSIKMPGEQNPDFARVVSDYMAPFKKYHVQKSLAVREELYRWCGQRMGVKFKDWFIFEGGSKDKTWVVNIRSPKHSMLFELQWANIIVKTIDRSIL